MTITNVLTSVIDFDIPATRLLVFGLCGIIILSYFAGIIGKKTNIPSVLLLIIMGIVLKTVLSSFGVNNISYEKEILEILGTVGLVFIVLEAALELKLTKEKWPIIWKSLVVALLALFGSSFAIAAFLDFAIIHDFKQSLVYAIPLSIMSSAIIIPSVSALVTDRKEFMVYESTFSDILGIMFFYLLLGNDDPESAAKVARGVFTNIALTIGLSVLFAYLLTFVLQKITSEVKLFMTVAVLLILYVVGKQFHLSPLILILAFGLMLNNHRVMWFGKLNKLVNHEKLESLHHEFHILTLETAFVIRTLFFVFFGMTIVLASLLDWTVVFYSLVIVVLLYVVRFLVLLLFKKKDILPLLYIAPRGLITILLFFQIASNYSKYHTDAFDEGILLVVIFVTSIIMTISLIQNGRKTAVPEIEDQEEIAQNLEQLPDATNEDSESVDE